MKANQADHPVAVMCRVLDLSRSGFYAWCEREPSARDLRDEVLLVAIREEHLASMGIYGAPRIHERLRRRGYFVSRKRVARLMREAGLSGVTRRKKWRTTKRDQQARRAPDPGQPRLRGRWAESAVGGRHHPRLDALGPALPGHDPRRLEPQGRRPGRSTPRCQRSSSFAPSTWPWSVVDRNG